MKCPYRFTPVPLGALFPQSDSQLSIAAHSLYCALFEYHDNYYTTKRIKIVELAESFNTYPRKIHDRLRELHIAGFIKEIEKGMDDDGELWRRFDLLYFPDVSLIDEDEVDDEDDDSWKHESLAETAPAEVDRRPFREAPSEESKRKVAELVKQVVAGTEVKDEPQKPPPEQQEQDEPEPECDELVMKASKHAISRMYRGSARRLPTEQYRVEVKTAIEFYTALRDEYSHLSENDWYDMCVHSIRIAVGQKKEIEMEDMETSELQESTYFKEGIDGFLEQRKLKPKSGKRKHVDPREVYKKIMDETVPETAVSDGGEG